MMSSAPERISMSAISRACSPVSGWETSRSSVFTPSALAYSGSSACSASMKAAMPPAAWAFATACRATVVFPLASGPYISTTRPRGRPPTPSATSSAIDPVGTTPIGGRVSSPRRITEPLPWFFSIWARASCSAFSRSGAVISCYLAGVRWSCGTGLAPAWPGPRTNRKGSGPTIPRSCRRLWIAAGDVDRSYANRCSIRQRHADRLSCRAGGAVPSAASRAARRRRRTPRARPVADRGPPPGPARRCGRRGRRTRGRGTPRPPASARTRCP